MHVSNDSYYTNRGRYDILLIAHNGWCIYNDCGYSIKTHLPSHKAAVEYIQNYLKEATNEAV